MQKINTRRGVLALSPIIVLLTIYLAGSIIAGDFYRIPITTAFIVASIYAVAITRGGTLDERIDSFSKGAANQRIMYMIWIFVLAGAFAALAKAMGAVDATVQLTLNLIPSNYLPAGIFIAACFISLSIGTSVGTIVALTPVVTALATEMNCDTAWLVAIVVGGAFFGDNLSFISDTTIAATQTQGCSMRSKFQTNIKLVTPAAVATLLLYAFSGNNIEQIESNAVTISDVLKCIPYLTVIICALFGMNVLLVLITGIVIAGAMGLIWWRNNGNDRAYSCDNACRRIVGDCTNKWRNRLPYTHCNTAHALETWSRACNNSLDSPCQYMHGKQHHCYTDSGRHFARHIKEVRHSATSRRKFDGHNLVLYTRNNTLRRTTAHSIGTCKGITAGDYPQPLLPHVHWSDDCGVNNYKKRS